MTNDKGPMTNDKQPEDFDALSALTRMAVGGVIEGADELLYRLQAWQKMAREDLQQGGKLPKRSDRDLLRFALIGFIFESEDKARKGLSVVGKLSNQAIASTGGAVSREVGQTRMARSVKRRFNALVTRGEAQVGRWAQRGAVEEPLGRKMLREAVGDTVDDFIEHLAGNEELVRQFSEARKNRRNFNVE
ncbi:MAG: hypothetical protein B6243_13175 [Anaerolineaceae bacterium 4572_5.2]|nr:MAG: hypothetical protein B6243_13175 [Anaerolineaceae bacterium 4572_5.2]